MAVMTKRRRKRRLDGKPEVYVVKHNDLINAHYQFHLTVQEQRLLTYMASMITPLDDDFKLYRIRVKEFMDVVGIDYAAIYKTMDDLTDRLHSKVLHINTGNGFIVYSLLSKSEYIENEGAVEISFHPDLRGMFLGLKERFTMYDPRNVYCLGSFYSIRIYEILKQYERIGKREVSIKDLRGLLGIKDEWYKRYYDFKRYVILQAEKELKKHTDIWFEFEEKKKGRNVGSIIFYIHANDGVSGLRKAVDNYRHLKIKDGRLQEIIDLMPEEDRQDADLIAEIEQWYTNTDYDYVKSNVVYTLSNFTKNFAMYLKICLEKDSGKAQRRLWKEKENERLEIEKRVKEEEQKKQQIENERKAAQRLDEVFAALPADQQKAIQEQAVKMIKDKHGDNPFALAETAIRFMIRELLKDKQ